MEITCNSTFSVIRAKKSSYYFEKALNFVQDKNTKKELLSIYNKIKTLRPISSDEELFILSMISSQNFIDSLRDIINKIDPESENNKVLSPTSLIISFRELIFKSRVIDILNHINGIGDYIEEGALYKKINKNGEKNIYLEVIESQDNYSICKDIKSGKTKLLDDDTNTILLESRYEFNFSRYSYIDGVVFIEGGKKSSFDYFLYNGVLVDYSKDSEIFKGKYSLYIIDSKNSEIKNIDLNTAKLSTIDLNPFSFLEVKNDKIIMYSKGDLSYDTIYLDNGNMALYDVQTNTLILENLSGRYFDFVGDYFIGLSFDEKKIYVYNFILNKMESFIFENHISYDDKLSLDENYERFKFGLNNF